MMTVRDYEDLWLRYVTNCVYMTGHVLDLHC